MIKAVSVKRDVEDFKVKVLQDLINAVDSDGPYYSGVDNAVEKIKNALDTFYLHHDYEIVVLDTYDLCRDFSDEAQESIRAEYCRIVGDCNFYNGDLRLLPRKVYEELTDFIRKVKIRKKELECS